MLISAPASHGDRNVVPLGSRLMAWSGRRRLVSFSAWHPGKRRGWMATAPADGIRVPGYGGYRSAHVGGRSQPACQRRAALSWRGVRRPRRAHPMLTLLTQHQVTVRIQTDPTVLKAHTPLPTTDSGLYGRMRRR